MTASRVTPLVEVEGVDVDGAEKAGGVNVSVRGYFDQSWALLRLMVAAFMAHITKK